MPIADLKDGSLTSKTYAWCALLSVRLMRFPEGVDHILHKLPGDLGFEHCAMKNGSGQQSQRKVGVQVRNQLPSLTGTFQYVLQLSTRWLDQIPLQFSAKLGIIDAISHQTRPDSAPGQSLFVSSQML